MDFIKSYFKIEERGSSVTTEVLAGITTFLAMAYILPVNTFMLAEAIGFGYLGAIFFATALSAALATLIMGLYAKLPVALAPGMGLNAFFTYTLVLYGFGLSPAAALAAVFISGILFLVLALTGVRKAVINAIPRGLKFAVGAGIGFFIAFIGLKTAGIIVADSATYVALGDLSHNSVLLGVFGIVLVIVLQASGFKYSLITSIIATAVVGLGLGALGVDLMPAYNPEGMSGFFAAPDGQPGLVGLAFTGFGELFSLGWGALLVVFSLLFVDFFDTAGTLMAVGNQAGLLNDEGEIEGSEGALVADAIGTTVGAVLGTSNVTSYIESSTGIEQGGRTGLSAVVTGLLFILSLGLYPVLSVFNGVFDDMANGVAGDFIGVWYSPVTAMALVLVGGLMFAQLKNLNWDDVAETVTGFLVVIFMMLTFSIAEGIAVGFIFYPVIKAVQGKGKEINPILWGLSVLFLIFFWTTTLG